jgi:polar amino acid transport system substrate-binding protein
LTDGGRVLEDCYTTIQQALGTKLENTVGAVFLQNFVEDVTNSGFLAGLLEQHDVVGKLQIAKNLC